MVKVHGALLGVLGILLEEEIVFSGHFKSQRTQITQSDSHRENTGSHSDDDSSRASGISRPSAQVSRCQHCRVSVPEPVLVLG